MLPREGGWVFVSSGFVVAAGSPLVDAASVAGEGAASGLGDTAAGDRAGVGAATAELADWPFAGAVTRNTKSAMTKKYFMIQKTGLLSAQGQQQFSSKDVRTRLSVNVFINR